MSEAVRRSGITPLADCPYCEGEGTDPNSALGRCVQCCGTGRVARFLAERTLARWARKKNRPAGAGQPARNDEVEDEVPAEYRDRANGSGPGQPPRAPRDAAAA